MFVGKSEMFYLLRTKKHMCFGPALELPFESVLVRCHKIFICRKTNFLRIISRRFFKMKPNMHFKMSNRIEVIVKICLLYYVVISQIMLNCFTVYKLISNLTISYLITPVCNRPVGPFVEPFVNQTLFWQ